MGISDESYILNKYSILICLILFSVNIFGQKNEISTSAGIAILHKGKAFKINYDRNIYNGFGLSVGIRNQNSYTTKIWPSGSELVQSSNILQYHYDGGKIDLTPFFSPINNKSFKLKIGAGLDMGYSKYQDAKYLIFWNKFDDDPGTLCFARYEFFTLFELGYHFLIQSNYYFGNNLFLSGNIMYGEIIKSYDLKPEGYSRNIYEPVFFNLSLGVGFRF